MKIALFLNGFGGGGAPRSTVRLANWLSDRGHEVWIVALRANGPIREEVRGSVGIVDLAAERIREAVIPYIVFLHRERPDVVISALALPNLIASLLNGVLARRRPVIVSQRGTEAIVFERQSRAWLRFVQRLTWLAYRRADAVVAVSDGVARQLAGVPEIAGANIRVIYNPIWSPLIEQLARAPVEHPWFRNDADVPVVLTVARLSLHEKGLDTLIEGFDILRRRRRVRLVILGEGEDRPALERMIARRGLADSVALPGFEANPFSYMARSAVLVLSSRMEGLGNVLIEAMACGVPVVATDGRGGAREVLDSGRYGPLVPVDDPLAMADALSETLDRPLDSSMLRERARYFSIERSASRYLELAEALVAGREFRDT